MSPFQVDKTSGRARAGRLTTPHGVVETPAFMPVGTAAAVKAVTARDLREAGAQIILANTYHLMLRPGDAVIAARGGLHGFTPWNGPFLTDSGGYQVFSLTALRKLTEEGVAFRSHLDGSAHLLSPERSMEIQRNLGADIVMAFDECPPYPAERDAVEAATARTTRWAARSRDAFGRLGARHGHEQLLFGIVQGGVHLELRERSAARDRGARLPRHRRGRPFGGRAEGRHDARAPAPRSAAARGEAALPDGRRHARTTSSKASRAGSTCSTA